jgi:hypothetical protein
MPSLPLARISNNSSPGGAGVRHSSIGAILAHLPGYPGIVGPNTHREAINPKPDGLVVIDNLPVQVSILTYMLILGKRFFLSGLAILFKFRFCRAGTAHPT